MNKIILKGRLISDPEFKKTPNDVSICNFCIAVNRRFSKDETDFINCDAWRKTAEFINNYFKKGQEILIIGELHIEKYEKDGEKKISAKVVVEEADFCGSKTQNQPNGNGKTEATSIDDISPNELMETLPDVEDISFF